MRETAIVIYLNDIRLSFQKDIIWLARHDGEGMALTWEKLNKILSEYYEDNF